MNSFSNWHFDNGAELLARDIPPQRWVIDGMLPEGLTLLCGAPKAGKSWLALDLALHVSSGIPFWNHPTHGGRVLLFALEDGERRLKSRMEKLTENTVGLHAGFLYPCFNVPPIESGFASGLDDVLEDYGGEERVSMVVIDTLGKIREPSRLDGYQKDYAQLAALKKIADKHHIAMLVVHHLRKMPSDDPFETISGTNGILGAADGAYVLKRNSRKDRNGRLFFTSRDADDAVYAVVFDDDCRWNILSTDAEQYDFDRRSLVQFLKHLSLPWRGFTGDLVDEYNEYCLENNLKSELSATTANTSMGKQLSSISCNLEKAGIHVSTRHTSKGTLLEITAI